MMVTWVNIIWFYRRSYLLDVSWRILRYFSYDAYGAKISEFITQLVIYPLIKSIVIASPQKRWPGKSTSQAMSDDVMIFPFLPCVEKRAHTAHTFFLSLLIPVGMKSRSLRVDIIFSVKNGANKKTALHHGNPNLFFWHIASPPFPRSDLILSAYNSNGRLRGYTLFADKPTTFLANMPQYSHNIPIVSPYYIR